MTVATFRRAIFSAFLIITLTWSANPSVAQDQPLPVNSKSAVLKKILSLPGAQLLKEEKEGAAIVEDNIPIFSVFYVYAEKSLGPGLPIWRKVGRRPGRAEGWISSQFAMRWDTALTLRVSDRDTGRQPSLYFDFNEFENLKDRAAQPASERERWIKDLVESVERGEEPKELVAMEDFKGSPTRNRVYLMPVFDVQELATPTASGAATDRTRLVNVASVNASASRARPDAGQKETELKAAKRALIFVIDATLSMGPYIDQARKIVLDFQRQLNSKQLGETTTIGVIAYRNNMDEEPQRSRLEYVTKVVAPPRSSLNESDLAQQIGFIQASTVSTHVFDEDLTAGLYESILQVGEYNLTKEYGYYEKTFVIITDAGALSRSDPRGRHGIGSQANINPQNVGLVDAIGEIVRAEALDGAVQILHLQTPEARNAGNFEKARQQYQEIEAAFPQNKVKYFEIGTQGNSFFTEVNGITSAYVATAICAAQGKGVDAADCTGIEDQRAAIDASEAGQAAINQLFAAQNKFLGDAAGTRQSNFFRAWVFEKDPASARFDEEAFQVGVMMTRSQLENLTLELQEIISELESGKSSNKVFKKALQGLFASTASGQSGDPDRASTSAFLSALPYKSDLLLRNANNKNGDDRSDSDFDPNEILEKLKEKLARYRQLAESIPEWRDPNGGLAVQNNASRSPSGGNKSRDDGKIAFVALKELP